MQHHNQKANWDDLEQRVVHYIKPPTHGIHDIHEYTGALVCICACGGGEWKMFVCAHSPFSGKTDESVAAIQYIFHVKRKHSIVFK